MPFPSLISCKILIYKYNFIPWACSRVQSRVCKTSTPIFNTKNGVKKKEKKKIKKTQQKQTRPSAEPLGVNCKWVLKNWPSHLGSTSHLSQTNEAPCASKWDWSPFKSRHWTPGFWILRAAPRSPWKPSISPPHPSPTHSPHHPILHWSDVATGTRQSFQLHQYSLIHRESWQQILDCITGWMFSFVTARSVWNGILN